MNTEDQIQELKFQIAEAEKAKPAESRKSLKPVKEEVVVKEVIKEVVKEVEVPKKDVPTAEAQAQTDIGMDYFDRERTMPKAESRGSNGSGGQSSKARVGGGGTIAKPPRQPSKHGSSSKANLADPLNITGASQQQPSEGPRRSKHSASSQQNGEPQLPNLLKNSRSNVQASRKSLMEQASQQQSEARESKKSGSHM